MRLKSARGLALRRTAACDVRSVVYGGNLKFFTDGVFRELQGLCVHADVRRSLLSDRESCARVRRGARRADVCLASRRARGRHGTASGSPPVLARR